MSHAPRIVGLVLVGAIGACACHRPPHPRPGPDSRPAERAPDDPGAPLPDADRPASPGAHTLNLRSVFPHVRADLDARVVEFDGIVPMDCHNPATPDVWLEQIVCLRDSKEHESLVMSLAKASEIHAALLLIGLEPGTPSHWTLRGDEVVRVPAVGPALRIEVITADDSGEGRIAPIASWAVNADTGESLESFMHAHGASFIFGGSRMVVRMGREMYDADGTGTVVGLASFGAETISFSEVISPEEAIDEPAWLADARVVPVFKTPVRVRMTAIP